MRMAASERGTIAVRVRVRVYKMGLRRERLR